MTTKPSVSSIPPGEPQNLFLQALRGLLSVLQKVFLPHLVAGMGLFMMAAYVTYALLLEPARLPAPVEFAAACVFFGLYGLAAFVYSVLAACAFALRAACASWEDFIDDTLGLVKEKVASKIDNMNEGLAKEQAKVVVAGSVSEVFGLFGKYERKSFLCWLSAILLGVVTFAMRSVLVARIVKISGTTVNLGKLFAGRATLAGAVFLNLRLFSTFLLGLFYSLGLLALALNFLFVFWMK